MDQRVYLKVKVKSLAAEAKIIRKEEKRASRLSIRIGLRDHRVGIVRHEARHAQLAYGFLKGRSYAEMEGGSKQAPDWNKIRKMVEKYGSHYSWLNDGSPTPGEAKLHLAETLKRFDQWVIEAQTKTPTN
jgi:hypothetical protein